MVVNIVCSYMYMPLYHVKPTYHIDFCRLSGKSGWQKLKILLNYLDCDKIPLLSPQNTVISIHKTRMLIIFASFSVFYLGNLFLHETLTQYFDDKYFYCSFKQFFEIVLLFLKAFSKAFAGKMLFLEGFTKLYKTNFLQEIS